MPEKQNRTPNSICEICGKQCYIRPNRLKKQKHITCSKQCDIIARSNWMKGEGNHQYGLKGELNSSFNDKYEKIHQRYKYIRIKNHPFSDKDGWIREHRYIAEQYLLNDKNSINIEGKNYLNPELEVHHIDQNPLNNDPNNLMVLTKSEHRKIHNKLKKEYILIDEKTGRFIKGNMKI